MVVVAGSVEGATRPKARSRLWHSLAATRVPREQLMEKVTVSTPTPSQAVQAERLPLLQAILTNSGLTPTSVTPMPSTTTRLCALEGTASDLDLARRRSLDNTILYRIIHAVIQGRNIRDDLKLEPVRDHLS